ncbi:MAG: type VI secretion system tip protein TssI/VgrG [Polyangiaceae bacterium]
MATTDTPIRSWSRRRGTKRARGFEYYEYPGRFSDKGLGDRYASMRLEELRAMAEGLSGVGQALSMTPGHKFAFEAPVGGQRSRVPAVDFDFADPESWVPVAVHHQWARHEDGHASVKTQFSARRGDLAYRPERRTPRARVKGPMLAMVTTRGEEIQCDEFGCVTVQYLWDTYGKQDDKSSGPVRVAQMQSSGSVAIPRRGWEVVVECEDGDPDKPIIVGRLYNGAQSPPASLPAEKTVTAFQSFSSPGGGGHNEIRINDGAGGELISSHAQKDMNVAVANDRNVHVANNSSVTVGANQTLSVGVARVEEVGANDSIAVTGNQSWTVGAVRTETVTGNSALGINGNRDATIGATHMTMTPKSIDVSTAGNLSETVGGLCLEASALETEMAVAGSYKAMIGGAKNRGRRCVEVRGHRRRANDPGRRRIHQRSGKGRLYYGDGKEHSHRWRRHALRCGGRRQPLRQEQSQDHRRCGVGSCRNLRRVEGGRLGGVLGGRRGRAQVQTDHPRGNRAQRRVGPDGFEQIGGVGDGSSIK